MKSPPPSKTQVSGGLERVDIGGRRLAESPDFFSLAPSDVIADGAVAHGRRTQLQNLDFHLGLNSFTQETSRISVTYGVPLDTQVTFDRVQYINYIAAVAASPNCAAGTTTNPWCGVKPLTQTPFNSTFGLLVFSAILACFHWLGLWALSSGEPRLSTWKHTFNALGGLAVGSTFFTLVGVIVFGTSDIEKDFCLVFDGDETLQTTPCGFSDGFGCVRVDVKGETGDT